MTATRSYSVAEILQPEDGIIQLTTRRISVNDVPIDENYSPLPDTTHRIVGPDTIEVFRWNGNIYQLESRTQNAPGLTITKQFDLLTDETRILVNNILVQSFQEVSEFEGGGKAISLVDPEGYDNARSEFWGFSDEDEVEWDTLGGVPSVATHNGTPRKSVGLVAGIVRAKDQPLCRLTVQRHSRNKFTLLDRIDLPCIVNFTRLALVDVTGDGDEELLLRTIPPYEDTYKTGASLQRLYIFAMDDTLDELAIFDGELNGVDGEGIRWIDVDNDGIVDILVGLPLLDIENTILPDNTALRFQIYQWNTVNQEFVAGDVWIPNTSN